MSLIKTIETQIIVNLSVLWLFFIDAKENDDFWKEKDEQFYNDKEDLDGPTKNDTNKDTEVDSSFHQRKTFSEKELKEKRLWIQKMKESLNKNMFNINK